MSDLPSWTRSHDNGDAALLIAIARGDSAALETLVRRYTREITMVAVRITGDHDDADDIVQAAFILTFRRASELDRTRPFRPWLVGVVRRLALKSRARRAHRHALWNRWNPGIVEAVDATCRIDAARDLATIQREIAGLPRMQRACFELVVLRGHGVDAVARQYAITASTVRQHVFRARRILRVRCAPSTIECTSRKQRHTMTGVARDL